MSPLDVAGFFDEATNTVSYVAASRVGQVCGSSILLLDFDPTSGRTDRPVRRPAGAFVRGHGLEGSGCSRRMCMPTICRPRPSPAKLGGDLAIGQGITVVQEVFGKIFNAGTEFQRDGSQFDRLFADGDIYQMGTIAATAMHTPGHTPLA